MQEGIVYLRSHLPRLYIHSRLLPEPGGKIHSCSKIGGNAGPDDKNGSQQRKYGVLTTRDAKQIATKQRQAWSLERCVAFGLPEVDDRYHVWRVPLLFSSTRERVGEMVIDAKTGAMNAAKSTSFRMLRGRLGLPDRTQRSKPSKLVTVTDAQLRNTIVLGDSARVLGFLPPQCVQMVFTSPPYYNARPDYTDYAEYESYLEHIRKVIRQCHRVLAEGRFFIINIAPVLLRRENRTEGFTAHCRAVRRASHFH